MTFASGDSALSWALIGEDGSHLTQERSAGITAQVFELRWRDYMPNAEGLVDAGYVAHKRAELNALRSAGFGVILSLGYHDVPAWVHTNYSNSWYVNQYGDRYLSGGAIDMGDANLVFNPVLRRVVERYVARAFADFGTDFAAVRLGGGRYGELTYPPASWAGRRNAYWAFDPNAAATNPTRGWVPGKASPKGQAARFLNWYLNSLVDFQNWQIKMARRWYGGRLMMLYPSWGIRPGQINLAVSARLKGTTSAEINGEIQRGFDFARQIAAITDPGVVVTTTWLDADASRDNGTDRRAWSPVKYLASLARANPRHLALYGENTGQGKVGQLGLSANQAKRYGLLGMAWYRANEVFSGKYATLADYGRTIRGGDRLPLKTPI